MKNRKTPLKITFSIILIIFLMSLSNAGAMECPKEETLTRGARIALVEAQKLIDEKEKDKACQTLLEFIKDYPDENHPYVSFTLAGLMLEKNKPSMALVHYQSTIDMCPYYAPAWQNMGKICFDLEKFDRAALAMEKAYELTGGNNHQLLFHAAVAHISGKSPEKALDHMKFLTSGRAGIPKPNWVKLMVNLSIEQKQYSGAIKTIENLVAQKAPDAYLFKLATSLYLQMNKYKEAAKSLSLYGMLTPMNIAEQTLQANLYNNLGIPFKAASYYEKVIKEKPQKVIYERLASSWLEACESEKAMVAAKKGLELYPESPALWKLTGWIFYRNKEFKNASKAFSRAVFLNKKDLKSLFMHGLCACRSGQNDIAKKALRKASGHSQYKTQALALLRQMEKASKS